MNSDFIRASLSGVAPKGFDLYERRHGIHQLIIPILHEDGDMVDIYLTNSPRGKDYIRICDFGLTLMRLSYTYDVDTPSKQRIFDSILIDNSVDNDSGNLFLDTSANMLWENILQFAGCVQKICSMSYWNRETVRSVFYDNLKEYLATE